LLLWAIVEQGRALSSLSAEDATAYRRFLRQPSPRLRWVGPARPRSSPEWRPFIGALAPRSVAYALSVLNAMFRWLVEQRYLLANPFAGIKVRGVCSGSRGLAPFFLGGGVAAVARDRRWLGMVLWLDAGRCATHALCAGLQLCNRAARQ
jgi:hypothetical protein